jgi:hypothetical protein
VANEEQPPFPLAPRGDPESTSRITSGNAGHLPLLRYAKAGHSHQAGARPQRSTPAQPRDQIDAILGGPRRAMIVVAGVVVLALAAIGLLGYGLTGGRGSAPRPDTLPENIGRPSDGASTATTPCAQPPQLEATSVDITPAGLSVSAELSAACSSGDVVSDSAFQVTISDGGRDVAAGTFNLSAEPMVIPPNQGVRREFVFPAGMYWRPPELLSKSLTVIARNGGGPALGATSSVSEVSTLTAVEAAPPAHGSPDAAAEAGLLDLAAADHAEVKSRLENRWVPQISSKRTGLVAEGITWDEAEILREHLSLRQRFDDVRLVRSADWRTFSGPNWWITVAGQPSDSAQTANRWCDEQGLDADHCYAKIISSTLDEDGTTVLRK